LNALRRDHQSFHDFALSPDSPSFALGTAPNCAEVACRFERLASDAVGLEFRADDRAVPVCFEPPQGQLTVGDEAAPFELLPGEDALDLRVFLDRSVLEVYVNGRTTLTTALPFVEDGAFEGRVFARGGTALVASADLWRMESALETP